MFTKPLLATIALPLLLVSLTFGADQALADRRVALVIGNSAYQNVAALPNPVRDAKAIAEMFRKASYDVIIAQYDLGYTDFKRAIRQFEDSVTDADVAVVYYSGLGIEIRGTDFLIPVDAKLKSDLDAPDEAVPIERLLVSVSGARKLNLIILDAGRDDPFIVKMGATTKVRNVSSALEPTSPNTLIAYAARAGTLAEDGADDHSTYASALLNNLFVPGLDIRLAFGRVRDDVLKKTSNRQEPFIYGSLGGAAVSLVAAKQGPIQATQANADPEGERKDYAFVEKLDTKESWDIFIVQYPTGFYSDLARQHLAKLQQSINNQNNISAKPNVGANFTEETHASVKQAPATRPSTPESQTSAPITALWWWPQWR
jgi:hypothetical protein